MTSSRTFELARIHVVPQALDVVEGRKSTPVGVSFSSFQDRLDERGKGNKIWRCGSQHCRRVLIVEQVFDEVGGYECNEIALHIRVRGCSGRTADHGRHHDG